MADDETARKEREAHARIINHWTVTADNLFRKLNEAPESQPPIPKDVREVLQALLRRALDTLNSLTLLTNESAHDHAHDGAVVLRALYDVHLQTLYMLRDPVTRSRLFRDYLSVQSYELLRLADKNDTDISRAVSSSFMRPYFEKKVREDYAAVRDQFLTNKSKGKGQKKLRENWYRGKLDTLATEVGLLPEYQLMQRSLSNSVHSTPLGIFTGAGVNDSILLHYAWMLVFRIVRGIVNYVGTVPLDAAERQVLDMSCTVFAINRRT